MDKENIIKAWDEADELREDFALSDNEIMAIIPDMRERVKNICELLQNQFSTEEYAKVMGDGMNTLKEGEDVCILCGKPFMIGENGNELGFCIKCQKDKGFPYDLDAYYKDHDEGKVAFKGFDTMSRGILEAYRR